MGSDFYGRSGAEARRFCNGNTAALEIPRLAGCRWQPREDRGGILGPVIYVTARSRPLGSAKRGYCRLAYWRISGWV